MIKVSNVDSVSDAPAIELTPLIDIVFIVIVFLLVTANVPLLKLPVSIPEASENPSAEVVDSDSAVITVPSKDALWGLDDKEYESWEAFKTQLQARADKDLSVSIAADGDAQAEALITVMSLLNEMKLENVQILMKPSE